ncbi:hypothetical protein KJ632_03385, partial [Patescibacteria group bacterium]|nr:hypothetical protein [Patescibacteria group bacterium]
LGFIYIQILLKSRIGKLTLTTDISKKQKATITSENEEIALEYIDQMYKDRKYKEVEKTCERLLKRDPDNNVIKILKAKAQDALKLKNSYNSLLK